MKPASVIAAGCRSRSRWRMRSTTNATTNAVASRFVHVRVRSDVSHRIFSKVSTESVRRSSQSSRESLIPPPPAGRPRAPPPARAGTCARRGPPAARCRAGRRCGACRPAPRARVTGRRRRRSRPPRPRPAMRTSAAATPAGGTAASTGRRAARYSYTLPETTVSPRPSACGMRSSSASAERCAATASPERHEPGLLPRVVDAERARPGAVGRAQVADEAHDAPGRAGRAGGEAGRAPGQERAGAALAEERARVHDRERPLRRVGEAVEVAQVDAVADHVRLCRRARIEPARAPRRSRR